MIQGLITYLLLGVVYYCFNKKRIDNKLNEGGYELFSAFPKNVVDGGVAVMEIVFWLLWLVLFILRFLGLRKGNSK